MRILHVHEVAGQASLISRAQRDLGVKSDVLVFNEHPFSYKYDICLNINKKSSIIRKISSLGINFVKCLFKYDVFHFHFGNSLLPYNIDLPILKLFRKKMVMHYWGSDIRQSDIAIKYAEFDVDNIEEICLSENDDKKRRKINLIDKFVNISIVGDYSLMPYSPKSIVIKQAIDLKKFNFVGCDTKDGKIRIVHAPSNRKIKGTKYILSIIKRLQKENKLDIDFILVENKSNDEAIEIYKEADIIIDQLLGTSHGILAIECMALGKPVLCRINEKTVKYYKELPILNTNKDNLCDNLKLLIENPNLRRELGKKGRKYVEEVHDSKKIAEQLLQLYKGL